MYRQIPSAGEARRQAAPVARIASFERQPVRPVRGVCRLGGLLVLLAACGGAGEPPAAALPDPPPASPDPTTVVPLPALAPHGHFRGWASTNDEKFHAEAVITVDGLVRVTIGGQVPFDSIASGAGLSGSLLNPAKSLQFAGQVLPEGDHLAGDGHIVSESCANDGGARFCDQGVHAAIRVDHADSGTVTGSLHVSDSPGEAWFLELGRWSSYYASGSPDYMPSGSYKINFAQFAQTGATVLNVFRDGSFFFQSPGAGCTGNGTLATHLDGAFGVYEVSLTVENCVNEHLHLNTDYTGLAIETQNGAWDYDQWLLLQVSARDDRDAAALTIYAGDP